MARTALADIPFPGRLLSVGSDSRSVKIFYQDGGPAPLYRGAVGEETLTEPHAFGYSRTLFGYLEPGDYVFRCEREGDRVDFYYTIEGAKSTEYDRYFSS